MENKDSSNSNIEYFEKIEYIQPPNIILNNLNKDNYNNQNKINYKNKRYNNNPINNLNSNDYDYDNEHSNINHGKNINYRNKYHTINKREIKNKIYNNSRNNINIYTKKKLSEGLISSSVTSGVNSIISNTQKNIKNNNIEHLECNQNNKENNNIYNIKTTNSKSTNILIKNIYSNDDYFNTNINEGFLHLKDFEIYKSSKISQLDIENQTFKQNSDIKPLSEILIKSEKKTSNYNLAKSWDSKKRNLKFKIPDNAIENQFKIRHLSPSENFLKYNKNGKISNLIYYFNKKRRDSDKIIIRGTRIEKGGVVDFSTTSPKKYYKNIKYIINIANQKYLYKYPRLRLISSAKIIQNWWRNKKLIYFIYLNAIKKIQNFARKYIFKNKDVNDFKNIKINKFKKIGVLIFKKIIEVKVMNLFDYFIIKLKNANSFLLNEEIYYLKYKFFIKSIIGYVKNIKLKNNVSFLIKLKEYNKYYNYKYFKISNISHLSIQGKKKVSIKEIKNKNNKISNYSKYELNYDYKKSKRKIYTENYISKIYKIYYRILFESIIDKIRKEANRRTLIKAFRNINSMKYPILFYSLCKLHKYSLIKFEVMNAYAKLIQRYYRDYTEKKSKIK